MNIDKGEIFYLYFVFFFMKNVINLGLVIDFYKKLVLECLV